MERERASTTEQDPGVVTVPVPAGPWDPAEYAPAGLVIIDGLLVRAVELGQIAATELLGPGDLVLPTESWEPNLARAVHWTAAVDSRLGVIPRSYLVDPEHAQLAVQLLDGAARQLQRAAVHAAICRLPRVADRVLALLWFLAERWGHVGPHEVTVPITLTHGALGHLVGSKRPTVTLALKDLGERGLVHRREDGAWGLSPDGATTLLIPRPGPPPRVLAEARPVPVADRTTGEWLAREARLGAQLDALWAEHTRLREEIGQTIGARRAEPGRRRA